MKPMSKLAPFPHALMCEGCTKEGMCNGCGATIKARTGDHCTNGRCMQCHATLCTSLRAYGFGHGSGLTAVNYSQEHLR